MAGLYYEQFEPGQVFKHAVTRTVTEMDNLLITTLSMNTQPLHLDAESTVKSKRLSKSRSDSGIVDFEHRGYNPRRGGLHLRPRRADEGAAVSRAPVRKARGTEAQRAKVIR